MVKVRIIVQPTGCLNGAEWPAAGETLDLPDAVATSMSEAGSVEVLASKVEKRPASKKRVETREG